MDTHSIGSRKYYPCPICNISIHNRKSFYDHMESHDKQEEKTNELLCRHCKETFSSRKDIEAHFKSFPKDVRIPCPFCKKPPFRTFNAYKIHKTR